MKNSSLLFISVLLTGTVFSQVIFSDNFDSYNVNNGLAYQSTHWGTWSDPAGGNDEDAKVVSFEFSSPYNSVLFSERRDIVYKLGKKTQGRYQISFNLFIRSGAYFNLEHDFKNVYALEMWFDDNQKIWFDNDVDSLLLGVYTEDVWHNIMLDIDLAKDSVAVFYDSTLLGQFVFSHSMAGEPSSIDLDVIDFYGLTSTAPDYNIDKSNFLLDDFIYTEVWPLAVLEHLIGEVTVFPNPTLGRVNVDLSSFQDDVTVVLRNVEGKVVSVFQPAKKSEFSFNIDGPSGIYFMELESSSKEKQVIKLVKN